MNPMSDRPHTASARLTNARLQTRYRHRQPPNRCAALVALTLLLAVHAGAAFAAPDTAILSGPAGLTDRADVVFWWAGLSDDPAAPVRGYRYSLDGSAPVFTESSTIALYALPQGEHRFRVAAVNARLEEDPTPAESLFTVGVAFSEEAESNDFAVAANDASSGIEVRGISGGAVDIDFFKVALLGAPNQVTVTFRRPVGGLGKTTVQLYRGDPALNVLLGTATASPENSQRVTFTVGTSPSVHYLRVQSDAAEAVASQYVVTVTGAALAPAYHRDIEPNDSEASANVRELTAASSKLGIVGSAASATDVDWYRIRANITTTALLRLTVFRPGSAGETKVSVYAGAPPTTDRQIARLTASGANGQFATFETGVTLSDVLVRVEHPSTLAAEPYWLFFSLSEPAGDVEVEPNGADPRVNPRSPTRLALDRPMDGTSWDGGADTDWYAVEAPRAGVLTIRFTRPSGTGLTRVRAFSPNFAQIGEATASVAASQTATLSLSVSAGTHHVELTPTGESSAAGYRLNATLGAAGVLDVSHSATRPLRRGEVLRVTATAPPRGAASFAIGTAREGIPLFDDGAHEDGSASDGVYSGTYSVGASDDLRDQPVVVTVRDETGGVSTKTASQTVTLDGVPPAPITALTASDRPDDDGYWLRLSWSASRAADLATYRVYISPTPIPATSGLAPALSTHLTSLDVPVSQNGVDTYIAVTAVDLAGNESALGGLSVFGPIRALDNRRPDPVSGVTIADTPYDYGGSVTARWDAALVEDFQEYRVYVGPEPIASTEGRVPGARVASQRATVADIGSLPVGAPVYVAVTVVDLSGNESAIGPGSTAGPATPAANATPDASPLRLTGPSGIVRGTSATFLWNRYAADAGDPPSRFSVQLDGRASELTSLTSAMFYGLSAGEHTVRVGIPGAATASQATFRVEPTTVREREPNEAESTATELTPNVTFAGIAEAAGDLYRLNIENPRVLALTAESSGEATVTLYRGIRSPDTVAFQSVLTAAAPRRTATVAVAPGVHWIHVTGSGDYALFASLLDLGAGRAAEMEPNDVADRALTLDLSAPALVRGSSQTAPDRDWFAVPVLAASRLEVASYRPAGSGTTTWRLYRGDAPVAEWKLDGARLSNRIAIGAAADLYFVEIVGEQASASEYEARIALTPGAAGMEIESNDVIARATPLPLTTAFAGDAWKSGDVDAYSVQIIRRGTVAVGYEAGMGTGTVEVHIRNAGGVSLASSPANPSNGGRTSVQADAVPGAYYLSVEPQGSATDSYRTWAFFVEELSHSATRPLRSGDPLDLRVVWVPGGSAAVRLIDVDGAAVGLPLTLGDASKAGVYTGRVTIPASAKGPLTVRAELAMSAMQATVAFAQPVAVDASEPQVTSVSIDDVAAFGLGAAIHVRAVAEKGLSASFAILRPDGTPVRAGLPLVDDGTKGDAQANDGVYTSAYTTVAGDDVRGGSVAATFRRGTGPSVVVPAPMRLTIDTVPPPGVTGVAAQDVPGDEGGFLRVTWDASAVEDFARYAVYAAQTPVVTLSRLTPIATSAQRDATSLIVEAESGVPFYSAVVAVDLAGNASPLIGGPKGSVSGAATALDNLPPEPVSGVQAADRRGDRGGVLTVRWSPSLAPDFGEYRIHLSDRPFAAGVGGTIAGRVPVVGVTVADIGTAADGVDWYVAVTAADAAGNESPIGGSSVSGPVRSAADAPPGSDLGAALLAGPVGTARQGSVVARWSAFAPDGSAPGWRVRLDDGPPQLAAVNELLFPNLSAGSHSLTVEPSDGSLPATVRTFAVEPLALEESEPNDLGAAATALPVGIRMNGTTDAAGDVDWYRVVVSEPAALSLHLSRGSPNESVVTLFPAFALGDLERIARVSARGGESRATTLGVDAGEYLVRVDGAPGQYRLAVALSARLPGYVWDVEPNGDPLRATPVGSGTAEIAGSANSADDIDWYRFDVDRAPGTVFELRLLRVGSAELYQGAPDASSAPIAALTSSGGSVATLRTGVAASSLYLRVAGVGSVPYAIQPAIVALPEGVQWEEEQNGVEALATRVPLTTREVRGTLRSGESDWFRVTVPDGALRLLTWRPTAPVGSVGKARALRSFPSALPIDVGEVALGDVASGGLTIPTTGGTYLFEMSGNTGGDFEYAVSVSLEPAADGADWELEPNGAAPRAGALRLGRPMLGSISSASDEDWFVVNLDPALEGALLLSLSAPTATGSVKMQVLSPGLVSLAETLASPSDAMSAIVQLPSPGSAYYMRISGSGRGGYRVGALRVRRGSHDGVRPLGVGGVLTARIEGDPGWSVSAELGSGSVVFPLAATSGGIYVGTHTVRSGENAAASELRAVIRTDSGIAASLTLPPVVTIDTAAPEIKDVQHNAAKALRADDVLVVRARTEPLAVVTMELAAEGFRAVASLYDDGKHEDGGANDGEYAGTYRVALGDQAAGATVTVAATDDLGNRATRSALRKVDIDTTPPRIASIEHDARSVLASGDRMTVRIRGEVGAVGEFAIAGVREHIALSDEGTQGDEVANDGVYTGFVVIREGDNALNALVSATLTDRAGNVSRIVAPQPVSIDTTKPSIKSVTHNATRSLHAGDKLIVRLVGEPEGTATLDIGTALTGLPLLDDGAGDDVAAGDGIYTASYIVRETDSVVEALVTATLTDRNGNSETRSASRRVSLDAIPPEPIVNLVAIDVPQDEGGRIRLTWQPTTDVRDFLRYQVYRQSAPIRSTKGMVPVVADLRAPEKTTLDVDVPVNNADLWFAVTAVDAALNESALSPTGGSTAGPVRATDDIAPASVVGVSASDAPDDNGLALLVRWTPSNAERDFAHYAVYIGREPLAGASLQDAKPAAVFPDRAIPQGIVPVPEDGMDLYVAVVAADVNGNRSAMVAGSLAGPVQSHDDIRPDPVAGVSASDSPSDRGGELVVSWKPDEDATIRTYEVYVTTEPRVLLRSSDVPALVVDRASLADPKKPVALVPVPRDDVPYYVALAAVDGGRNRSLLGETSVAGPVRSIQNILSDQREWTVRGGLDARTSVTVPQSIARPGMRIDILTVTDSAWLRRIEEANLSPDEANIDPEPDTLLQSTTRWFSSDTEAFPQPITVTMGFPALDPPDLAQELRVFRLNASAVPARWELVSGVQRVDVNQGVVTAQMRTLGVLRVARLVLPRRLDRVVLYPNPFSPETHGVLTFRNLTADAVVDIFTLDARRVRTLTSANPGTATWDGRDGSGHLVATGLYIYLVRGANARRTGQIFVAR